MAGRPPKPTMLKLVTGNPGKRALNASEAKPRAVAPKCPEELSPAARAEWRRISRQLLRLGLLTEIDRAALAAYSQAWAQWLDAVAQLQRTGAVVKAPSGYPMLNPYLAVANQAYAQMKAMLTEFGMSPASRSRVVAGQPAAEQSPADRYFSS